MNPYERERDEIINEFIENYSGGGKVFYWDDMKAIGLFMADWANERAQVEIDIKNKFIAEYKKNLEFSLDLSDSLMKKIISRNAMIEELEITLNRYAFLGNDTVSVAREALAKLKEWKKK